MPARAPKDPHAPKKYQSSYFLFSNERRPLLQSENKSKPITEISKMISAEWKLLTTERKATYDILAKQGRAKYERDLSEYKQTSFYREHLAKLSQWKSEQAEKMQSQNNRRTNNNRKNGRKLKKPKKPKQPEAMPKRPQSSYFIFSNERRPQLRIVYTDKKVTELSGLISKEWREKTEAEKKLYEEKANVNKERYHREMDQYKKTEEYSDYMGELDAWKKEKKRFEKGMDLDDDSDDYNDTANDIKLPRKPKDTHCPKRPLTSYFLYAKDNREATKKEFPTKPITEIAKEISKKWNMLTEEDKKPFNEEAAKLKAVYNEKLKTYKESSAFQEFEVILKEWKAKCDEIKKKNRLRRANLSNNRKKNNNKNKKTNNNTKKNVKSKKKARYYDSDSDSDASMSSSGSSGSDDSSGSSGSSSASGSNSYDSDDSSQSSSSD